MIFGFCEASAAGAAHERRGGCVAATFGVVRIRLARFALPRLGLGGSKSGVSCSPLVCRVRGTIENVRASCRPHRSCLAFKLNKTTTNPVLRIHCGILFLIRHITTHFSHKIHRNLPCIRCIRGCWGTPSGLRPSALATSDSPRLVVPQKN